MLGCQGCEIICVLLKSKECGSGYSPFYLVDRTNCKCSRSVTFGTTLVLILHACTNLVHVSLPGNAVISPSHLCLAVEGISHSCITNSPPQWVYVVPLLLMWISFPGLQVGACLDNLAQGLNFRAVPPISPHLRCGATGPFTAQEIWGNLCNVMGFYLFWEDQRRCPTFSSGFKDNSTAVLNNSVYSICVQTCLAVRRRENLGLPCSIWHCHLYYCLACLFLSVNKEEEL